MDVAQELVDVAQLEDLLVGHHKYQFELIVQFVLERQILVIKRIRSGPFLWNVPATIVFQFN